jgi:hypothetical protein
MTFWCCFAITLLCAVSSGTRLSSFNPEQLKISNSYMLDGTSGEVKKEVISLLRHHFIRKSEFNVDKWRSIQYEADKFNETSQVIVVSMYTEVLLSMVCFVHHKQYLLFTV